MLFLGAGPAILWLMDKKDIGRFAQMHGGPVWTTDEEALDTLLWYGADVIWGEGPVMVRDGGCFVNGQLQDPAGFPEAEPKRGYGSLVKGGKA